jgi:glycosyltransferase involved in cell wall biosynthesis
MKISVIIPVYNVDKYLSRCLDCVLGQTYSNLEVILVNDGSTDNSAAICEKYAALDSRVIFFSQDNKGVSSTRNAGLKIAKGEYVGFIDPDDKIELDMFENFVKIVVATGPDVIVSNYYDYEVGNVNCNEIKNDLIYNVILRREKINQFFLKPYFGGFMGIIPSCCTKLYKLSFLRENNLFFNETLKRAEDYWFNFLVFKKASNVYAIDKAFYHYYKNKVSAMRTFREDEFANFLYSREKLLDSSIEFKFDIDWKKVNKNFIDVTNEFILNALKNNRKDLVFAILGNKEYNIAFNNMNPDRFHTEVIQKSLRFRLRKIAFLVYKVWAIKSNKITS